MSLRGRDVPRDGLSLVSLPGEGLSQGGPSVHLGCLGGNSSDGVAHITAETSGKRLVVVKLHVQAEMKIKQTLFQTRMQFKNS